MTEILRSKDGVPIWNGEAGSFQEFEGDCIDLGTINSNEQALFVWTEVDC